MHDLLLKAAQQAEEQAKLIASLRAENVALKAQLARAARDLRKVLGITEDSPVAAKIDGGVS
jgi:multidrug resistance efflux pump